MFLEIVLFHSIMENVKMSIGRFGRKILNVRLKVFKKKTNDNFKLLHNGFCLFSRKLVLNLF